MFNHSDQFGQNRTSTLRRNDEHLKNNQRGREAPEASDLSQTVSPAGCRLIIDAQSLRGKHTGPFTHTVRTFSSDNNEGEKLTQIRRS